MEEVTFRNKQEDLEAYYEYMLNNEEGRQLGKRVFTARLWFGFLVIALVFTIIWGVRGYLGASIGTSIFLAIGFIFAFVIAEVFVLAIMGFKPYYYVGKQVLEKNKKSLTAHDIKLFQLPRTIKIDDDWLEVRNSEVVHQWRWGLVDAVGITSDFIFLHAGKCCVFYIPKRDFPSDEKFQEFGKILVELQMKNKDQSFATGSVT